MFPGSDGLPAIQLEHGGAASKVRAGFHGVLFLLTLQLLSVGQYTFESGSTLGQAKLEMEEHVSRTGFFFKPLQSSASQKRGRTGILIASTVVVRM